ncbi:AraC family transcriptional regulator [Psychromonas sp. MB-3u-54]|uniref:GlxA family transcriptional regulator n=1 Tax=Psychromonas sp. MB-3u-54 TaxID=2058319 RepID=UPI000C32A273|nr:helix-turn-helix domain-containing protein [Psychromonas sp. MB-3u-54]PKH02831.1 AraC family transcriptional regulator [Psychromonas sp. MB-3u-54]
MTNFPLPIIRIAVLAPQGCSLLSYGAIAEPFLLANQLLEQHKYHLTLIACAEPCVAPPAGVVLLDEAQLANLQDYDLLIVIAEKPPLQPLSTAIKKALQRYYQQQAGQLLAVKAGVWWLLESGIGLHQKIVVHWSLMDDFKDCYPDVMLSHDLYQTDLRLSSCAGQLAIVDYLLGYLDRQEGAGLANQISDHLCMDRVRGGSERQRLPSQSLGDLQPRLTMAIDLMENNIEEPLTTEQIAELVFISRRHLERLFRRYLNTMPARHYLQMRLKRAHHLLQTSNKSIVQIGLICGFSSGPHFSSTYKSFYQTTPRQERAKYLGVK